MKKTHGFTLFEIMISVAVLTAGSLFYLVNAAGRVEATLAKEEDRVLQSLQETITLSFQSDLGTTNVSALPGTIGPGITPAEFDGDVNATPERATTTGAEWYSRIARIKGINPVVGGAIHAQSQPALFRIIRNARGRSRILVPAPAEPAVQRYLLLSLLTPESRPLVIPANDGTPQWFDEIANYDWQTASDVPAGWVARLTPAQLAAWRAQSSGRTSQVSRLRVVVITQPKFRYGIDNLSPTESVWVDCAGQTVLISTPNSGANQTPELLWGRWVKVRRGVVAPGNDRVNIPLFSNQGYTVN